MTEISGLEVERSPVQIIQILADAIADKADHPEVWQTLVMLNQEGGRERLGRLAYLLSEILRAPQEPEALRVLTILHAVILAQLGKVEAARSKLVECCNADREDRTAAGALAHVRELESAKKQGGCFVYDLVSSHGGVRANSRVP